jgi:hypothetical protein
MTTNETPGPSGTVPDQYLEDISADELSANAPADEMEALDQVESRVHTTLEQCLMSITTIARQAQGMRAGEVIAKLAEDTYFMRVDNRVTQVPPRQEPSARQRSHKSQCRHRPQLYSRGATG